MLTDELIRRPKMYIIPPKNHKGLEDQAWIQDFLEPKDIERLNKMCARTANNATVTTEADTAQINSEVRSTSIKWVERTKDNADLWEKITNAIVGMNDKFFKFDITGIYESMQLGTYSEEIKGFYDFHMDATLKSCSSPAPRKLSMAMLLNDPSEFEGGDLVVMNNHKEFVLEQQKGRAWFMPSWTLHKVTPVTKGVRKSLVVWAGGPPFK